MSLALRDDVDLYKEYVTLYNRTPKLDNFEDYDETWEILKFKKGLPVKYVDKEENLDYLPMDTSLIGESSFYNKHDGFYLIPNEVGNTIISFVLRGLQKQYIDYRGFSTFKPFFGIYNFKDFKRNNPIIITEGAKDCIVLQREYPFVLALLGKGITKKNLTILKKLTNKIILAYDNDYEGRKQTLIDLDMLRKEKINVLSLKCPRKDFGMCKDDSFKEDIQSIINSFPQFSIKEI